MKSMIKITLFATFMVMILALPLMALGEPIPDTGQTGDYTATFGEDSDYTTNPHSYTKLDSTGNPLSDGAPWPWAMVKDNVTGLIWEVKTDDGSIHDKGYYYTWQDVQDVFIAALNTPPGFGGFTDWRMPTVKELSFIVHSDITTGPTIDQSYFPNTVSFYLYYWSSTTYAVNTVSAWLVWFDNGIVDYYGDKLDSYYVRAVRAGQSTQNFVDNGAGTVTDTATGLMWQQATAPGYYTWEEALTYCEGLSLAGHDDWRLPDRNQLQTIVDYSTYNPAIDTTYFPDTMSSSYWSSTTYALSTGYAWIVYFSSGYVGSYYKSANYYVRAVRAGQCGSFGDSDDDGICDDGDNSGTPGDNPCTGGETESCDDNCPETPNGPIRGTCSEGNVGNACTNNNECGTDGFCSMNQEDSDEDGVGDVCECEVSLAVGEVNAHPGDAIVQIAVIMSNPNHEVVAIETLLVDENNNLTCTGCTPDPVRAPEFMCFAYDQGEGGCKVVMVDLTDPTGVIAQGDGPIFIVDYMISGGVLSNECISVTPADSIIADSLEDPLSVCEESGEICFISCGDVYPGGTCGDGVINIFDILEEIDFVLGITEPSACQAPKANVPTSLPPDCIDPDDDTNIFDVLVIIDKALDKPNCCDAYDFQ